MKLETVGEPSRRRSVFFSVIVIIGFFCLGFAADYFFYRPIFSVYEKREEQADGREFKYINPLLECESSQYHLNRNMGRVRGDIEDSIASSVKRFKLKFASVYYRDLNNGPWFGINERADFAPASLIKVPLMMAYFYEAEKDPSVLQKTITVDQEYSYAEQNIVPESKLHKGQTYTVEDLIERMMAYSDNYAYALLLNNIDNNKVYKVYLDMGITLDNVDEPGGNVINVKDYSAFFRVLFNSSYLSKAYSEKALGILTTTKFSQGLVAGTPSDIMVAHKFGERKYTNSQEVQLHDCGIVYFPGRPYLLCIMTRGSDLNDLSSFIAETSRKVYSYVKLNNSEQ